MLTAAGLLLLGCTAIYLGSIGAAFAALMQLSLRLSAERSGRSGRLGVYLDDPVLLFLPIRALLGAVHISATLVIVAATGLDSASHFAMAGGAAVAFVVVCEHLIPYWIVRHDPARVLDTLVPSFDAVARWVRPLLAPLLHILTARHDQAQAMAGDATDEEQQKATAAYLDAGEQEGIIERDERQMLQSIVDFSDTLVREVMTPRPDIVAIETSATLDQLRTFFRDQEYSRIPVYTESLDNIVGFVFIKDLMRLPTGQALDTPVATLVRPTHVVPETKRVSELLREFQRQQLQIAIVVDEYGGTAGLVTLEDLIEEIVGEIRDEYDVETEPIVDETGGQFLVSGKADIEAVSERLGVPIEREGFETFGGFIMARLGRVPSKGEVFTLDDLTVEVLDAERRRVHRLRVTHRPGTQATPAVEPAANGEPQDR